MKIVPLSYGMERKGFLKEESWMNIWRMFVQFNKNQLCDRDNRNIGRYEILKYHMNIKSKEVFDNVKRKIRDSCMGEIISYP